MRFNGGDFAAEGAIIFPVAGIPEEFVLATYYGFDLRYIGEPGLEGGIAGEHFKCAVDIAVQPSGLGDDFVHAVSPANKSTGYFYITEVAMMLKCFCLPGTDYTRIYVRCQVFLRYEYKASSFAVVSLQAHDYV